jgi:hypothetical protein
MLRGVLDRSYVAHHGIMIVHEEQPLVAPLRPGERRTAWCHAGEQHGGGEGMTHRYADTVIGRHLSGLALASPLICQQLFRFCTKAHVLVHLPIFFLW